MCSIGTYKSTAYRCSEPLLPRSSLTDEESELLRLRSGCKKIHNVCAVHKKDFLGMYALNSKKCCNPLNVHRGGVTARLVEVSLQMHHIFKKSHSVEVIPGKKICQDCFRDIKSKTTAAAPLHSTSDPASTAPGPSSAQGVQERTTSGLKPPGNHRSSSAVETKADDAGAIQDSPLTLSGHSSASTAASGSDVSLNPVPGLLETVNGAFKVIGVTAIDRKKLRNQPSYALTKLEEIHGAIKSCLSAIAEMDLPQINFSLQEKCEDAARYEKIKAAITHRFQETKDRSLKIQLLSVFSTTLSVSQLITEFQAPDYMVRQMRKLVMEQGMLPKALPRKGHPLSDATVKAVKDFYYDEEFSRPMPGIRDCKSVKEDGVKEKKSKRLLLVTLNELHALFSEKYGPGVIGFSKFASLRPPECVFAGSAGTHSVCVCTIHQNTELMARGAGLRRKKKNLTAPASQDDCAGNDLDQADALDTLTFDDCIDMIMCIEKSEDCYLNLCKNCPSSNKLEEALSDYFEKLSLSSIMYKQWVSTDRCSLETLVKDVESFIPAFVEKLVDYKKHNFIAKKQAQALKSIKENLECGVSLTLGDFGENVSFLIQDAVQSYYWSNVQGTLHPFVSYFRPAPDAPLQVLTLIVISDYMKHNTLAVHTFQKKLVDFLKERIPNLKKIIYFSDGAASQYKNKKNVANLVHHLEDFGVDAEWNYFATSHGKSSCDAAAGTAKREAAKASKRGLLITNPVEFYIYLQENLSSKMSYVYVNKLMVEINEHRLADRLDEKKCVPVPGIRSLHCLIPLSTTMLKGKPFSNSSHETIINIDPRKKQPNHPEDPEENVDDELDTEEVQPAQGNNPEPQSSNLEDRGSRSKRKSAKSAEKDKNLQPPAKRQRFTLAKK